MGLGCLRVRMLLPLVSYLGAATHSVAAGIMHLAVPCFGKLITVLMVNPTAKAY
jgi:hypothetical protein